MQSSPTKILLIWLIYIVSTNIAVFFFFIPTMLDSIYFDLWHDLPSGKKKHIFFNLPSRQRLKYLQKKKTKIGYKEYYRDKKKLKKYRDRNKICYIYRNIKHI